MKNIRFGVNYIPSKNWLHSWINWDAKSVEEDLISIKKLGIDTAKGVLGAPRDMLVQKADLEEDTVDEILNILKAEFEE